MTKKLMIYKNLKPFFSRSMIASSPNCSESQKRTFSTLWFRGLTRENYYFLMFLIKLSNCSKGSICLSSYTSIFSEDLKHKFWKLTKKKFLFIIKFSLVPACKLGMLALSQATLANILYGKYDCIEFSLIFYFQPSVFSWRLLFLFSVEHPKHLSLRALGILRKLFQHLLFEILHLRDFGIYTKLPVSPCNFQEWRILHHNLFGSSVPKTVRQLLPEKLDKKRGKAWIGSE